MADRHVVIVGGGVIGLCCAWYALREGWRVTVIERNPPDHDGCSLGNAGMVVPSHFVPLASPGMPLYGLRMLPNPESPFGIRMQISWDMVRWGWLFLRSANAEHVRRSAPILRDLNLASRQRYEELAAEFENSFGLQRRGLLMLCRTQKTLDEEAHLAQQAVGLGVPAEVMNPAQLAALDPGITMQAAGGVWFPRDCHLSPNIFVAELRRRLAGLGAELRYVCAAEGWRAANGRIEALLTSDGELQAQEYVLAAGAWSPQTVHHLGLRMPMQAGKGYSFTLQTPRQLPNLCSILTEARVAVTPMGATLRFAGTMEIGGNDETINQRRVAGIRKSIPHYFPQFRPQDFEGLEVWSGLRPCSPDGLPYLGRWPALSNLTIATGHAMMGLSLAPITGRLVADILEQRAPGIDLQPLNPARFA